MTSDGMSGKIINDSYEIIGEVARGGMATVFPCLSAFDET